MEYYVYSSVWNRRIICASPNLSMRKIKIECILLILVFKFTHHKKRAITSEINKRYRQFLLCDSFLIFLMESVEKYMQFGSK